MEILEISIKKEAGAYNKCKKNGCLDTFKRLSRHPFLSLKKRRYHSEEIKPTPSV
jgi:recombination DNA repair RAD52 pathway protein